jgi:hypothetical protein
VRCLALEVFCKSRDRTNVEGLPDCPGLMRIFRA